MPSMTLVERQSISPRILGGHHHHLPACDSGQVNGSLCLKWGLNDLMEAEVLGAEAWHPLQTGSQSLSNLILSMPVLSNTVATCHGWLFVQF